MIEWAIANSVKSIRNGLPHWASSGLSYLHKKSIRERIDSIANLNSSDFERTNYGTLNCSCELTSLEDLYVERTSEPTILASLAELSRSIFFDRPNDVSKQLSTQSTEQLISQLKLNSDNLKQTFIKIQDRLTAYLPRHSIVSTSHGEQQERELQVQQEMQQEEEREVNRPECPKPHKQPTSLSGDVLRFVTSQNWSFSSKFYTLPKALQGTAVWNLVEGTAWSGRIRESEDFVRVVQETRSLDQYLRPPN